MALIAIASDKGAPGVTTSALALAAVWPRPVLLAECDPSGGDLAYRFPDSSGGHVRVVPHGVRCRVRRGSYRPGVRPNRRSRESAAHSSKRRGNNLTAFQRDNHATHTFLSVTGRILERIVEQDEHNPAQALLIAMHPHRLNVAKL